MPLAGEPGTVAVLTTPDALDGGRALNPDNRYPDWRQAVAARSALRIGFYRPGRYASRVRCPLLVVVCDQDQSALPGPAAGAARRSPRAELVHLAGGHYAPFLDGHEQAVEAELSFLRAHLIEQRGSPRRRGRGTGHEADRAVRRDIQCQAPGRPGMKHLIELWDGPIADLAADHRCIAPTLPLGAHRHAMHADTDLSLPGGARALLVRLMAAVAA